MNLRGGGYATTRTSRHPDDNAAPQIVMEHTGATAAVLPGRTPLTKKLILSLLVLLQVCFITCLWLLQLGGINSGLAEKTISVATEGRKMFNAEHQRANSALQAANAVNFIRRLIPTKEAFNGSLKYSSTNKTLANVSNFRKDFYLKTQRLNNATMLDEVEYKKLWCFREGSINDTHFPVNAAADDDSFDWNENAQCRCRPGWHGKDCGQPEIMLRALINAKSTLKLRDPQHVRSHRLIYLLEGNFFNLDLLDLQINLISSVVDFYVIYVRQQRKELTTLERKLRETITDGNFLLFHCSQTLPKAIAVNCSASQAYAYFRKQLQRRLLPLPELKPTDLFLYTDDRGLLSHTALQFLKYYATDVPVMSFRLKYVVYGFYWQHPAQTHLTGAISSFVYLDDPQRGAGNPATLQRRILANSNSRPFLIGDLNHFGGWFCKYCQQPDEIIAELHAEASSLRHVRFPNATRNGNIDVAYLQKLIATGIYVDAKTQLERNRRYTDKYYAPLYAEANSWKFGNLLVNLYESFDDDIENEMEAY